MAKFSTLISDPKLMVGAWTIGLGLGLGLGLGALPRILTIGPFAKVRLIVKAVTNVTIHVLSV